MGSLQRTAAPWVRGQVRVATRYRELQRPGKENTSSGLPEEPLGNRGASRCSWCALRYATLVSPVRNDDDIYKISGPVSVTFHVITH